MSWPMDYIAAAFAIGMVLLGLSLWKQPTSPLIDWETPKAKALMTRYGRKRAQVLRRRGRHIPRR